MDSTPLNNLIVILIFGSLLLLSFIKFTNPLNINRKGNFWFALFLFLYATFWLEEIAGYVGCNIEDSIVAALVHYIQIFTPVFLYMSVLFYTKPTFVLISRHLIYLIVPFIFLVICFYRFTFSLTDTHYISWIIVVIILCQALFYSLLSYIKIEQHQKQILLFASNTRGISLLWLKYIVLQVIVVCVVFVLYNILASGSKPNLLINTINLFTVYIIAFYSLMQKEIFPINEQQKSQLLFINANEEDIIFKKKLVSDDELERIKSNLTHVMETKKPYLDSELNLVKLADMLSITPHQLSYSINSGLNGNFFQYINKYRVEMAKELLLSTEYESKTMLAIAFDSGFNSKTSFNTTFKKMTNQTPSQFKKSVQNIQF